VEGSHSFYLVRILYLKNNSGDPRGRSDLYIEIIASLQTDSFKPFGFDKPHAIPQSTRSGALVTNCPIFISISPTYLTYPKPWRTPTEGPSSSRLSQRKPHLSCIVSSRKKLSTSKFKSKVPCLLILLLRVSKSNVLSLEKLEKSIQAFLRHQSFPTPKVLHVNPCIHSHESPEKVTKPVQISAVFIRYVP
jgi:hypothetical protein